jgi:hypothetical protein
MSCLEWLSFALNQIIDTLIFPFFRAREVKIVLSFAACEPEAGRQEGGKVQELRHNYLYQVSGEEQLCEAADIAQ